MAPVYKIALIQLQPKDDPVAENFAEAESYIPKAAAQGAHLAVLPEYHLTSWCPKHAEFVSSSAESAKYLPRYQTLARELNINIVPGTICEIHPLSSADGSLPPDDNTKLFNGKPKNLWHPERPHLAAGFHIPHTAFDTLLLHTDGRPIRADLLVCWGLAFPEAFRALVADGAELVVIPSWWHLTDVDPTARAPNPLCEKVFLESAAVARAFENTCAVAFCNASGVSQVAVPILGAIGGTVEVEVEEMRILELDFGVLGVAEGNYKVRQDMRGKGWHYGYTLYKDGAGKGEGHTEL
ncbi:carbon-nitrogen hydrolase [Lasiosphaeria ovina]|uniref:Carbon-nitrogen hydrolase n=1 Tax=Lasiosphaeria ovina TaxID=92902 RepID=A0AAE0K3D2_9PEZI|nr:carbon-nitrogen hydrolase [Lasiosphaeria ovina]